MAREVKPSSICKTLLEPGCRCVLNYHKTNGEISYCLFCKGVLNCYMGNFLLKLFECQSSDKYLQLLYCNSEGSTECLFPYSPQPLCTQFYTCVLILLNVSSVVKFVIFCFSYIYANWLHYVLLTDYSPTPSCW